jgi:pimeloyl-ACP methyl ester carboxylesterase
LAVVNGAMLRPLPFPDQDRVPTLMINGRYDAFYTFERSQLVLFRLLGTPEKDKRHVIRETGHIVPRDQMSKDVLDWLDRYLGPVRHP